MGGSWDATNVVDAPVSVVTPIDLDHRHFLGDTVEEIAGEKAGIIKADAITVVGLQQAPEAVEVLVERATDVGARIVFEGNDFGVTARDVAVGGQQISLRGLAAEYPDLFLPLHGTHQAQNAAVAVAAVEAFLGGGEQALDIDVLRAGLASVDSPGRLEIVRRSPTVLVDAAHNPAGARALRDAIQDSFTFARLVGVVAVMKDKDAAELLEALEPVLDEVVVTRTSSPRAMSPRQLGEIADRHLRRAPGRRGRRAARRPRPRGRHGRRGRRRHRRRARHRFGRHRRRGADAARHHRRLTSAHRPGPDGSVVEVLAGERTGSKPFLAGELPDLPRGP